MNRPEIEALLGRQFHECEECQSKPGSPVLCKACLGNRALVNDLKNALSSFLGLSATHIRTDMVDPCFKELGDFCIKWGHLAPDSMIYSAEVSAGVDDICKIKVGLYANKGKVG